MLANFTSFISKYLVIFLSCFAIILSPSFNGVNGLGKGFPRREPMPAAKMTIFKCFCFKVI